MGIKNGKSVADFATTFNGEASQLDG